MLTETGRVKKQSSVLPRRGSALATALRRLDAQRNRIEPPNGVGSIGPVRRSERSRFEREPIRITNIWLDVARYADTRGGLNDNERHTRRGDCETWHPDAHCCSIDARAKNQWPACRGR
jgi:hypothetical protein